MPNLRSLELREQGELIQAVDNARAAGDPFKLDALLRALLDARLIDATAKDFLTFTTEGARLAASGTMRTAYNTLEIRLRDGYNFIKGIPSDEISDADRLGLFTMYGWDQGEIGVFTDLRRDTLAQLAPTVTPSNPAWKYSASLLTKIAAQITAIDAQKVIATGGESQAATTARDVALDLLDAIIDRIRFYYCSRSDARDQTDELTKIGFTPRRDPGDAQETPFPGATGTTTFDAAALTLALAALPANATTIRAFRKVLGGDPELAGTSNTTTVSVVQLGPLTPGATYEFWVVGHNHRGDGPESNHVTHAVPVGP